jgi:20S proteasome alpha/beta subunit
MYNQQQRHRHRHNNYCFDYNNIIVWLLLLLLLLFLPNYQDISHDDVGPGRGHVSFMRMVDAITYKPSERHSFSLTTFDPNGKLSQVEYALLAASFGPPIIGVILPKNSQQQQQQQQQQRIVLASPQILPSPLMDDDGTSRFAVVSPEIILGHTGIAADGRVVTDAAQRLAIEHSYTYDEPIPVGLFLEELSLFFQEYTMKRGSRPFGCTLVVGYIPSSSSSDDDDDHNNKPRLFRIDCSGSVTELESIVIINGNFRGDGLQSKLLDMINQQEEEESKTNDAIKKNREQISYILQEALEETTTTTTTTTSTTTSTESDNNDGDEVTSKEPPKFKLPMKIISASFDRKHGLTVERRDLKSSRMMKQTKQ